MFGRRWSGCESGRRLPCGFERASPHPACGSCRVLRRAAALCVLIRLVCLCECSTVRVGTVRALPHAKPGADSNVERMGVISPSSNTRRLFVFVLGCQLVLNIIRAFRVIF